MMTNGCRSGFGRCSGRACPAGSHPRPSSSVYSVCCQGSRHRGRQGLRRPRLACLLHLRPESPSWHSGGQRRRSSRRLRCSSLALGYLVANRLVLSKRGAEVAPATAFSPAAALDRGAAVREPERRQGAGVLLRWAHGGAAQLAGPDQRAAGRRPHLAFSFKEHPDIAHRRAQAERGRSPRRERAALSEHHPHHRAVDQRRHGLSPVVEDL